jgi:signal transduction histidine kinase
VQLTLAYSLGAVALTVADNGAALGAAGAGFGLAGLRERAEQLGGSLSAGPLANEGYALTIELPVGVVRGQP